MKYNDQGEELPDKTPLALPIGWKRPPSINEMVAKLVRRELELRGDAGKIESFEEADDFGEDEDDSYDPSVPFEKNFDINAQKVYTRDQEIRAGFVEEIPTEKKEKARAIIERAKQVDNARVDRGRVKSRKAEAGNKARQDTDEDVASGSDTEESDTE